MRKIGQAGLKLIMTFEGCRLTAYKAMPTEQYYTIGYGHYGPDVQKGMQISAAQAEAYLIADCEKFAAYVDSKAYVPIELNDNQRDALISFTYNCGPGNLKKLCAGRTDTQIADKLLLYNKAGGQVLTGLQRRRSAERDLFLSAVKNEADAPAQLECLYKIGSTYRTKVDLNVRVTAGGSLKKWSELTADGKRHSTKNQGYAVLKKGTAVTCKEIKTLKESIWMKIPSGWICARSKDKVYI